MSLDLRESLSTLVPASDIPASSNYMKLERPSIILIASAIYLGVPVHSEKPNFLPVHALLTSLTTSGDEGAPFNHRG